MTQTWTRVLKNPPHRRPIRADFPEILTDTKRIIPTIETELAKLGESFQTVGHITIAYPHKHPVHNQKHKNKAHNVVTALKKNLDTDTSPLQWQTADAIYEERRLNRSTILNALPLDGLTRKQSYRVDPTLQKRDMPFLDPADNHTEYFILADDVVAQGTTLANLTSYIEHNGGKVLAVYTPLVSNNIKLAQSQPDASIIQKAHFQNQSYNTGRIPELGLAFAESAHQGSFLTRLFKRHTLSTPHPSPEDCITQMNEALAPHGRSLFDLTDGECTFLQRCLTIQTFPALLAEIQNTPPDLV